MTMPLQNIRFTFTKNVYLHTLRCILYISCITTLIACGDGGTTQPPNTCDTGALASGDNIGGEGNIFDESRLLDIQVSMSEDDFLSLRNEGRTLASTARQCQADFEYTEFSASVRIDNELIENVNIRKKGFLGSLSKARPSLKLDFDDCRKNQSYQNVSRMTLNNNRQDPSNARQCLAYKYFAKAGLVAPRCNFARVTVNNELLGIYTHIEPIKKPFLQRNFGDDEGNLYEAQVADFGLFLNEKFEKKTNKSENDRSDLQLVSDFLSLDDNGFIQGISSIINIDEFIRYWAMETLIGHWDSASGNANNFYIYRSPIDNLFHFIPWGADASFTGFHFLKPDSGPLYRNFNLSSRLYQIPIYRTQYLNTLSEYLINIWDESELATELNRIAMQTGTPEKSLNSIRQFILGQGQEGNSNFIRAQRARLESAVAGLEPPEVEYLLSDQQPDCTLPHISNLVVNANSVEGSDTGTFSFTLPNGNQVNASISLASTNIDSIVTSKSEDTNPNVMSVLLIGADINDGFKPYVLQIFIEEPSFTNGAHQLHGFATNIILFEVDNSIPSGVKTIALGEQGLITLNDINISSSNINLSLAIEAQIEFSSGSASNSSLKNSLSSSEGLREKMSNKFFIEN